MCNLQMERSEIPTVFLTRRQSQETVQMWETLQTLALPKTVDLQSNVFFPLRMAHVEALVIWLQNIIPYIIHLYEYNL